MNKTDSGQIVLIIVLVTVLGLTVGLSLIARTVTDVRISSQIEQSGRAFSAAEAGIETALRSQSSAASYQGDVSLNGAQAQYQVKKEGGTTDLISYPVTTVGQSQTTWLAAHNDDGSINEDPLLAYPASSPLDFCWGKSGAEVPAMIVSLVYKDGTEYKLAKGSYDPITTRGNNFSPADSSGNYCDGTYPYKKTMTPATEFSLPGGVILLLVRLTPAYANASLAVKPSTNLPVQGKIITAVGKTGTDVVRKIQVKQGFQTIPSFLDFTLFSEN